jgi:hypothetical protein
VADLFTSTSSSELSNPDAATRWRMASLIIGAAAIAGTIVRGRLGG